MSWRTVAALASATIVLLVVARFYLGGHQVPAGQPPLGDLISGPLDTLKSDFNRNSDQVRVILLLSPT
jgi:hypothetical protein